jgi:hypothetical protein
MWKPFSQLTRLLFLLIIAPAIGYAGCDEDFRSVRLSNNEAVRLRTFVCRADTSGSSPSIRVEFHRLSDMAASALVARGTSTNITGTLGSPKVIENAVFNTYASLLRQFGSIVDLSRRITQFRIEAGGSGGSAGSDDNFTRGTLATLGGTTYKADYPALSEFMSIRDRVIPSNLSFFYSINCLDANASPGRSVTCAQYDASQAQMIVWRPMRADDVSKYERNVTAYNRLVGQYSRAPSVLPRELKLMNYLAGDSWPNDFVILSTTVGADGCEAWNWGFMMREAILDVMLIENISTQRISVDSILGIRSSDSRLRTRGTSIEAGKSYPTLQNLSITLEPGGRLLIPTRINFVQPEGVTRYFSYHSSAAAIYRRIGAKGFRGNTSAHASPNFTNYIFGPDIAISGILLNGNHLDLRRRSANFIDATHSAAEGSCPYLLSWDVDTHGWIDHGKVLDKALGGNQEYTDVIALKGFSSRFRLEERESEIAFIDQVQLVVTLRNGVSLSLKPHDARLVAHDGDYLQLYWGEAIEIDFSLPHDVDQEDVAESRFLVTGFYERYSSFVANKAASEGSFYSRPPRANFSPMLQRTLPRNVACPILN